MPTKKTTVTKDGSLLKKGKTRKAEKYKILLVGPAKTGKTYFACSWPKPLVINTDFGLKGLEVPSFDIERYSQEGSRDKDVLCSWRDVYEILDNLRYQKGKFWDVLKDENYIPETIVLDSISSLTDCMEAEIILSNPDRKGKLQIQDYDTIKRNTLELVSTATRCLPAYHFIATIGIDVREDNLGVTREQPMATGRKLGPSIPHYFDDVYICSYEKGKWILSPKQTTRVKYSGTRSNVPLEDFENPTYEKMKEYFK